MLRVPIERELSFRSERLFYRFTHDSSFSSLHKLARFPMRASANRKPTLVASIHRYLGPNHIPRSLPTALVSSFRTMSRIVRINTVHLQYRYNTAMSKLRPSAVFAYSVEPGRRARCLSSKSSISLTKRETRSYSLEGRIATRNRMTAAPCQLLRPKVFLTSALSLRLP